MFFPTTNEGLEYTKTHFRLLTEIVLHQRVYYNTEPNSSGVYRTLTNANANPKDLTILKLLVNKPTKDIVKSVDEWKAVNNVTTQLNNLDHIKVFIAVNVPNVQEEDYLKELMKDVLTKSFELVDNTIEQLYSVIPSLQSGLSSAVYRKWDSKNSTDVTIVSLALSDFRNENLVTGVGYPFDDNYPVPYKMEDAIAHTFHNYFLPSWFKTDYRLYRQQGKIMQTSDGWLSSDDIGEALWDTVYENSDYLDIMSRIEAVHKLDRLLGFKARGKVNAIPAYSLIDWAKQRAMNVMSAVIVQVDELFTSRAKPKKPIAVEPLRDVPKGKPKSNSEWLSNLTGYSKDDLARIANGEDVAQKARDSDTRLRLFKYFDETMDLVLDATERLNGENIDTVFRDFCRELGLRAYSGNLEHTESSSNNSSNYYVLSKNQLNFLVNPNADYEAAFIVFKTMFSGIMALKQLMSQLSAFGLTILDMPSDLFDTFLTNPDADEPRYTKYSSLKEMLLATVRQNEIETMKTEESIYKEQHFYADVYKAEEIPIRSFSTTKEIILENFVDNKNNKLVDYQAKLSSLKAMSLHDVLTAIKTGEIQEEPDLIEEANKMAPIDIQNLKKNLNEFKTQTMSKLDLLTLVANLIHFDRKDNVVYWSEEDDLTTAIEIFEMNREYLRHVPPHLSSVLEANNLNALDYANASAIITIGMIVISKSYSEYNNLDSLINLFANFGAELDGEKIVNFIEEIKVSLMNHEGEIYFSHSDVELNDRLVMGLFNLDAILKKYQINLNLSPKSNDLARFIKLVLETTVSPITEWLENHKEHFGEQEFTLGTKLRLMFRKANMHTLAEEIINEIKDIVITSVNGKDIVQIEKGRDIVPILTSLGKFKSNRTVYSNNYNNTEGYSKVETAMSELGLRFDYSPREEGTLAQNSLDIKVSYIMLNELFPDELQESLKKFRKHIEYSKRKLLKELGVLTTPVNEAVDVYREFKASLEFESNKLLEMNETGGRSALGILDARHSNPVVRKLMSDKKITDSMYVAYNNGQPLMYKTTIRGESVYYFIHLTGYRVRVTGKSSHEQFAISEELKIEHFSGESY